MANIAYQNALAQIADGKLILLDGGTGTELEQRGAKMHSRA